MTVGPFLSRKLRVLTYRAEHRKLGSLGMPGEKPNMPARSSIDERADNDNDDDEFAAFPSVLAYASGCRYPNCGCATLSPCGEAPLPAPRRLHVLAPDGHSAAPKGGK